MPANKPEKNVLNEMKNLRAAFAHNAAVAEQTARELGRQANDAMRKATELREKARVYEKAIDVFLATQSEATATQSIELLDKKSSAKIANRNFVFLIDGSGSMQGAPINSALDAGVKISDALAQKSGTSSSAVAYLFGDSNPPRIDLSDADVVTRAKGGINSGTDLAPTIEALAAGLDPRKVTHAVILSDGDIFDREQASAALRKFLKNNSEASIDVIIITDRVNSRATMMEEFISEVSSLSSELPEARRPRIQRVAPETVATGVSELLAARLKQVQPRKPKNNPAP